MTNHTIRVDLNGHTITAEAGTKISELLSRAPHPGPQPPVGAIANRRLTGLYRTLTSDAVVRTLDYSTKHGAFIFRRSLCLMFLAVLRNLYPNARAEIGQSLGNGYSIEVTGLRITEKTRAKIEKSMHDAVAADAPFLIDQVFVDEAVTGFEADGFHSKVRFLTQIPRSDVRLVTIMGFRDILHGPVAISTGALTGFRLEKFGQGLVLSFPRRDGSAPDPIEPENYKLLFETVSETKDWNQLVGVSNVSDLNEACVNGKVSDLIKVCESLHEKKYALIADMITKRGKLPKLIVMAGPSSSGKTTSSQRIGVQLRVNGVNPCTIAMDNYYVDREKTPKHPDGSYDFESVYALDLKLFNQHMEQLSKGKLVQTPIFNFMTGKREKKKTIPMQLGDRDVMIIEGIHALNPLLHESVSKKDKFGIFVSALTQLSIDEHNRIFTSDQRLIRRMVRDRLYRGYSAKQTIDGWLSVRAGEDKYIFPFQGQADVMFNSALVYEPAVIKHHAKRFLLEVPRDCEAFTEAVRLYAFLEYFIPILPEEVPFTSVLREFIGGSSFQY